MRYFLVAMLLLVLIGGLGLVGYALFFDLPAPERDITVPVEPR